MDMESCVPPGFRFHPTEEELVAYYLNRKVNSLKIDLDVITEIDLYRMEPWDIEERCKLGYEEQKEWYFFSHKDRKYPTGTRTNRATAAGFWKATGRDKAVLSKESIIGMRKTLVYYKGRAPNGRKSDWIMHEYRLQTSEHGPPQEEGWVVCRAFKKPNPSHKQGFEAWNNNAYCIRNSSSSFRPPSYPGTTRTLMDNFDPAFNQGSDFHRPPLVPLIKSSYSSFDSQNLVELPNLDSPSMSTSFATNDNNFEHSVGNEEIEDEKSNFSSSQFSDWKRFDKIVASHQVGGDGPSSSSSYAYTNINDDYELDAQNHFSHVLECFLPDL